MEITILHVEDDPALAKLVQVALNSFGLQGSLLAADSVRTALALLGERSRKRQPVDLILTDMQLPDGTGLDILKGVRGDPHWRLTPVLVLSGQLAPGVVGEAYALGANCYLPKSPDSTINMLRSLYECWVESAVLPSPPSADRVQDALYRAINLRTRASGVYLRLADIVAGDDAEARFWLERSMSEGNLSNLLVLFRNKISEKDFPVAAIERLAEMQVRVEKTLKTAEIRLQSLPLPDAGQIYEMALDLAEGMDEEVIAESLGYLFPKSPAGTMALRERAVAHFSALVTHLLQRSAEPEIRARAKTLRARAARMAGAGR